VNIKKKITANELTVGSWITIGHNSIVEIMATAGFDWLAIDMEHSAITLDNAQELITVIQSKNIGSFVRVGENSSLIIKRVMDAGADGVIVPMVNSKEDALQAVNAVKYPPEGNRGVGLARAQNYGIGFDEYKEWQSKNSVVIAQIEHIQAVEKIDEIISVEGIDGVIIGPYDLSASLKIPGELENEELTGAINHVKSVCKVHNHPFGFHVIKPDYKEVKIKIDDGYSIIGFSLDFFFLGEKARNEMLKVKK